MHEIHAKFNVKWPCFSLDVDLKIPSSGITALFGPSGSGKTTILRCIAGLERVKDGYLNVAGEIWQDGKQFLPTHKRPLGYVFQEASLFRHLTVSENLLFGMKRAKRYSKEQLHHLVRLLDIENLLVRKADSLSGGERQRVGIARALAVDPRILLMDEPLSALDFKLKQEIIPYLERLHQELEIPVLYVSHSLDEVLRLADHLVLLDAGREVASGSPFQLLSRLDLPLVVSEEAEALIEARVVGHHPQFRLTQLQFEGEQLLITEKDIPVGSSVRVRVKAKDVSITLQHQSETSVLNIFAAKIDTMIEQTDGQVLVRLLVGNTCLLSCISRKSSIVLALCPGMQVYAQVKSVACLPAMIRAANSI